MRTGNDIEKYFNLITEILKEYPKGHNPFKYDEDLFLRLCREAEFPSPEKEAYDYIANLEAFKQEQAKGKKVEVKSISIPYRRIKRLKKEESRKIKEIILSLGEKFSEFTASDMKKAIKREFPILDAGYILSSQIAYLINTSKLQVVRKEKKRSLENPRATVINYYSKC
jgi:aspartokinase